MDEAGKQSKHKPILVFQSDFTYAEGAVSSMYGVVMRVDPELRIFDGTHQIPQFDIWSASYRLYQSLLFWPEGTIYVSVVDPGVGTSRRACAALTSSGHVVITPDNGTLTHLLSHVGIREVRRIDESVNRYPPTRATSVFAGRDVFGYTAARLASGIISWEEIGPAYDIERIVTLPQREPSSSMGAVSGMIEIIDPNFGNIWTNIPLSLIKESGANYGDALDLNIFHNDTLTLAINVPLCHTYAEVRPGELLAYINELSNVAVAVNQGSATKRLAIGYGPGWYITCKTT